MEPLPFPEVRDHEKNERFADEEEQKAIQQIINNRDLRESDRSHVSGERDSKRELNFSNQNEGVRYKVNFFIWIIGLVVFGVLLVGVWRLMRKQQG